MKERHVMQPKQYFQESTACTAATTATTGITMETNTNETFQLSLVAHAAALHHLYFVPEAKLVFCGIPKVGMSEWIKLVRKTYGAHDYLSNPHFKADTIEFQMSNLPREAAQRIWNDPTWTKAVLWRNPAERLLSAYLDKIVRESYTQEYFHIVQSDDEPVPVLTFAEFVHLVASPTTTTTTTMQDPSDNVDNNNNKRGVHYRVDPHWRPQLFTCGMDHLLPLYDFVGSLDHLPEHTKLLLARVGLWESHGKLFDAATTPHGNSTNSTRNSNSTSTGGICSIRPPVLDETNAIGFNQQPTAGNMHSKRHATGAREKMD
jgi:hypothetical protein